MSLTERIDEVWYGPKGERGVLPIMLGAASWPYRLGLYSRQMLYQMGLKRETALSVPCVSVGNLVVGGTGKTPMVSWIIGVYREAGPRPAIISRGYGGSCRGPARVTIENGAEGVRRFGDEPVTLAALHRDTPVIIGRDRLAAGTEAAGAHGAEVLVADDAFQHRKMARDMDIVVVDAGRWFGNGRLFPRGPLREPLESLERADVILLNRVSSCSSPEGRREALKCLAPRALVAEGEVVPAGWRPFGAGPSGDGPAPRGPVYAFCGLANPGVFRRSLEAEKLSVSGWRSFPDHYPYRTRDLETLSAAAGRSGASAVVTTAKDAVRIASWPGPHPLYVLDVRLEITLGADRLRERLLELAGLGTR